MRNANILVVALAATAVAGPAGATTTHPESTADNYSFDDSPRNLNLKHPPWFKLSFLDFREDLEEALEKGKKGIIVYFTQEDCAYCKAFQEVNLAKREIVNYVTSHFDVIGVNIFSDEEITDPQGRTLTVKEYSVREGTHFTPSLIFYTEGGRVALKLRGFNAPYEVRAALEYVADGHYLTQTFADYLALAEIPDSFPDEESLAEDPLFAESPYMLDRSRFPAERPLVVIFEQSKCHPCDVLHNEPLQNDRVRELLADYEAVQLNVWDKKTPVITPEGMKTTPNAWARELGLFYAPTLVFFDEAGKEILRIDSVVQFYRLGGVLEYVAEKAYLEEPVFQRWRRQRNVELRHDRASVRH